MVGAAWGLLAVKQTTSGGATIFLIDSSDFIGNGIGVSMSGLTLTGANPSSNVGNGIAIYNLGSVSLDAMMLTSNSGGAVENYGVLAASDCTFSGNSSSNYGGAIFNYGSTSGYAFATVTNCTFSANSAKYGGGAIDNEGTLTLVHSTFSGNTTASSGGGIRNYGIARVIGSTFSTNAAQSGGGFYAHGSITSVADSIIAGNIVTGAGATDPDVFGSFSNTDHDLIGITGDAIGFTTVGPSASLVGTSAKPLVPKLGLLANNGGLTQTMALLPGSPAIEAGDNHPPSPPFPALPATDQRGLPRIVHNAIDIGAFEAQDTITPTAVAIGATEGAQFGGTLTTFSDPFPNFTSGSFAATISWGDGTTTAGTVIGSAAGGYAIAGKHTYAEEASSVPVTVVISDAYTAASVTGIVTVSDAPLTAKAVTITPTEGKTFSGTVATFTDADPAGAVGDYTATIVWGDGKTTTGAITEVAGGGFAVVGTHVYSTTVTDMITVTIADAGGSKAVAKTTAKISNPPATVAKVAAAKDAVFSQW